MMAKIITVLIKNKSTKIDTKKLKGSKSRENLLRLRIDNYRIVYFEDVRALK